MILKNNKMFPNYSTLIVPMRQGTSNDWFQHMDSSQLSVYWLSLIAMLWKLKKHKKVFAVAKFLSGMATYKKYCKPAPDESKL